MSQQKSLKVKMEGEMRAGSPKHLLLGHGKYFIVHKVAT